jgi:hypothetical protein
MDGFEDVLVYLLILVRVFLVGIVIWFVAREIRRSGRTKRRK